jgi:hypothetical protein
MIESNGQLVVEEDEVIYGEYLDMVDKKPQRKFRNLAEIA